MSNVVILGAGQIGRAVYKIITDLRENSVKPYNDISVFVVDSDNSNIRLLTYGSHYLMDVSTCEIDELTKLFVNNNITYVINALPFFLNKKIAVAAHNANCNYIDFTEDDEMATAVTEVYKNSKLTCAVKCGLAPGFINYVGADLAAGISAPDTLTMCVGALPRVVSYDASHPELSYNFTWSLDGLVNEYIRPCRIRKNGKEVEVPALSSQVKVVLDGVEYEAAHTSGGAGSLVSGLPNIPNLHYMTLRYPGHYRYVRGVIQEHRNNFSEIKDIFSKKFPYTTDDVIVVYASVIGYQNGQFVRNSYYNKFYGVDGMTGIQTTTAASGVAILELMLTGKLNGIIDHLTVKLPEFNETRAFKTYYKS